MTQPLLSAVGESATHQLEQNAPSSPLSSPVTPQRQEERAAARPVWQRIRQIASYAQITAATGFLVHNYSGDITSWVGAQWLRHNFLGKEGASQWIKTKIIPSLGITLEEASMIGGGMGITAVALMAYLLYKKYHPTPSAAPEQPEKINDIEKQNPSEEKGSKPHPENKITNPLENINTEPQQKSETPPPSPKRKREEALDETEKKDETKKPKTSPENQDLHPKNNLEGETIHSPEAPPEVKSTPLKAQLGLTEFSKHYEDEKIIKNLLEIQVGDLIKLSTQDPEDSSITLQLTLEVTHIEKPKKSVDKRSKYIYNVEKKPENLYVVVLQNKSKTKIIELETKLNSYDSDMK